MGGYGTWEVALAAPDRFAALVPVCGGVRPPRAERPTLQVTAVAGEADPYTALATRLKHVPTDYEQRLVKNDFNWLGQHRDAILNHWPERYHTQSEPKGE